MQQAFSRGNQKQQTRYYHHLVSCQEDKHRMTLNKRIQSSLSTHKRESKPTQNKFLDKIKLNVINKTSSQKIILMLILLGKRTSAIIESLQVPSAVTHSWDAQIIHIYHSCFVYHHVPPEKLQLLLTGKIIHVKRYMMDDWIIQKHPKMVREFPVCISIMNTETINV